MAESKKCPVDRGKLLIALECCVTGPIGACVCEKNCPYRDDADCTEMALGNALAYIYYLEERLEEAGKNDA